MYVQAVEILEPVQLGLGADGGEDGAVVDAELFGLNRASQRGARTRPVYVCVHICHGASGLQRQKHTYEMLQKHIHISYNIHIYLYICHGASGLQRQP